MGFSFSLDLPDGLSSCGSARRSVKEACLKLPDLVKVEFLGSNVMVTPHSLSRLCFLSKQAANAQPTA